MSGPEDRVDFSRNAPVYDKRHGALLPPQAVDRLAGAAGITHGARILDVGAGTGRVAIPFAAFGCHVTAMDVAPAMLETVAAKTGSLRLWRVVGDAGRLPFAHARFDVVVIARMLYLLPTWRGVLAEVARVLVPNGTFLHEWGNGLEDEPWVRIREKARSLFEQGGVRDPFHPGARTLEDVDACTIDQGFRQSASVTVENDVQMTLADFLHRIATGECSYIWNVPARVQQRCLPELEQWAARLFDLSQPAFTREFSWTVYRR